MGGGACNYTRRVPGMLDCINLPATASMSIRLFRPGDEAALFRVFHSAIHMVCARDYSAAQCAAWAPAQMDMAEWAERMRLLAPFVVEHEGEIIAYADLQPSGYIDHFFVSGQHQRQGTGGLLMARIHEDAARHGILELTSHVSLTAEPFFRHYGFEVVHRRYPVRNGVTLEYARMRKALGRASDT